jgi:hypothetical protein
MFTTVSVPETFADMQKRLLPKKFPAAFAKHKRYIYIAGPYSNEDTVLNVRNAVLVAEELVKLELIPYIPHLTMFWHLIAPHEYEFWLNYDLNWLSKCDVLLRLPGESKGADAEVEYAQEHGIPVYYSLIEIKEELK